MTTEKPQPRSGRAPSTLLVGALAGFLIASTAYASQGTDLRPNRAQNLPALVAEQAQRMDELESEVQQLREENDELLASQTDVPLTELDPEEVAATGLGPVSGPAIRVTLTDAPVDYNPTGVDDDALVVHEHDIQQVVNALWAAGAEAMTIQGQRVVSTTAVKCVGNTVVLHGVPYAPPYVIEAIGDVAALEQGLENDEGVTIYRQYAQRYRLGYSQQRVAETQMPAFEGGHLTEAQVNEP